MRNFLKHLFLPHHTNNFRAKVLQVDFFAAYIVIFFLMTFGMRLGHRINPDILGYAADIRIERLLDLTNEKREEVGVPKLKLDTQLSQAAAKKAEYMFAHNFWAHTAPDGTTPWTFINQSGYVYALAGENLAKNFSNSDGVIEAWTQSPSHRENLLRGQYEDIGFAVVDGILNGEETTLVVQMFGRPLKQNPLIASDRVATAPGSLAAANLIPRVVPGSLPSKEQLALNHNVVLTETATSIIRKPFIDIFEVSKKALFGLSTGLMIALVVDAIYIWRRKIVRISGRTVAHLLFLFIATEIMWMLSVGSIL